MWKTGKPRDGVGGAFSLFRLFDVLSGRARPAKNGELTVYGKMRQPDARRASSPRSDGLGRGNVRVFAGSAGDPGGEAR